MANQLTEEETNSVVVQELMPEQLNDVLRNANHLVTSLRAAKRSSNEDEHEPTSWDLEELRPEQLREVLKKTDEFVARTVRGLWARQVPFCWYFHQDLGLALIAANVDWQSRVKKESGRSIYAFLGDELHRFIIEPLCKPIGDGEKKHRLPGGESHQKEDTTAITDLKSFIESEWFGWIWLGQKPPVNTDSKGGGEVLQ
jgi:hypothetical protein